ncbi:uncharacterized protein BXZ73DRAFT_105679 [Epithele typhae]|uniref:uncharacterized protein n=1 Tax=Epithele typhae TaxID=378194 RepID=UPI002008C1A0|nr:uncharacterized protein BXZ73DRAFT_105679 [Epithele typhae]KAH9916987.1 hypothetical protein BXZ73DRAFT_105679 [Epithele typhae]
MPPWDSIRYSQLEVIAFCEALKKEAVFFFSASGNPNLAREALQEPRVMRYGHSVGLPLANNGRRRTPQPQLKHAVRVVAVVTGGGTGIGLMIVGTLVANGARVYIIGLERAELDKITSVYNDAAERSGKSGRMYAIEGDVSKKSEAKRLAEELAKREPHITVLFSNAGITAGHVDTTNLTTADSFRKAYFDDIPEESFARVFSTNAVATYWLTFAFLPLLERWKASPGGADFAPQIIVTSSMVGWAKDPATCATSFPYMFSKSAVGHAVATLAHALLPLGVRVNGIAPGLFATALTAPGGGPGARDAAGNAHFAPGAPLAFDVPLAWGRTWTSARSCSAWSRTGWPQNQVGPR